MRRIIFGISMVILFCGLALGGVLTGRIIRGDGSPLSKTKIIIEGRKVVTNEFGGYAVKLPDGEHELRIVIDGISYISQRINIYSPRTKQNWRIDHRERRLIKIR